MGGYPNCQPLAFPAETCHTTSINKQRTDMAVTLTANYTETLTQETVDNIQEWCIDGDFELKDALEFIDEHGEDNFNAYYEDYIDQGEKVGYEIVDAFIEEEGFCDVEHCEDAFVGIYASGADFAEEYAADSGDNIPDWVVVDWEATWNSSLSYDYTFVEGGIYRTGYVFRRYY